MDRGNENDSLELQIRGPHLIAGGIGLLALCVAIFFMGRWWERTRVPAGLSDQAIEDVPEILAEDDLGDPPLSPEEVDEQLTFYDNLSEPSGGAGRLPPARSPSSSAPKGNIVIQVLATQDESAARRLEERLKRQGFDGYVESGRDGSGQQFFRVRVGPFAGRSEADQIAKRLQREENLSTWVRTAE
jgi:DedD protein